MTWVVYRHAMTFKNHLYEANAVCQQAEWDAMDLSEPGTYTLVRAGFESESDAEKHARGTSGDDYRRGRRKWERGTVAP